MTLRNDVEFATVYCRRQYNTKRAFHWLTSGLMQLAGGFMQTLRQHTSSSLSILSNNRMGIIMFKILILGGISSDIRPELQINK